MALLLFLLIVLLLFGGGAILFSLKWLIIIGLIVLAFGYFGGRGRTGWW